MHRPAKSLIFLVASALAGCGSIGAPATKALPSKAGTHGGTAFPLPDGKGYAEVVVEPVKTTKKGRDVVLAMYFVTPDQSAALEPAPTGVTAKMTVPGEAAPLSVTLNPKSLKPKDGRLASEVGPYDHDEIHGEIQGTFDGKPFTVPIAIR